MTIADRKDSYPARRRWLRVRRARGVNGLLIRIRGWLIGSRCLSAQRFHIRDELQQLCDQVLIKVQLWVNSLADVPNMARTYVPKTKSGAMGVVYSALEGVLNKLNMLASVVETDDAFVWHVRGVTSN